MHPAPSVIFLLRIVLDESSGTGLAGVWMPLVGSVMSHLPLHWPSREFVMGLWKIELGMLLPMFQMHNRHYYLDIM